MPLSGSIVSPLEKDETKNEVEQVSVAQYDERPTCDQKYASDQKFTLPSALYGYDSLACVHIKQFFGTKNKMTDITLNKQLNTHNFVLSSS